MKVIYFPITISLRSLLITNIYLNIFWFLGIISKAPITLSRDETFRKVKRIDTKTDLFSRCFKWESDTMRKINDIVRREWGHLLLTPRTGKLRIEANIKGTEDICKRAMILCSIFIVQSIKVIWMKVWPIESKINWLTIYINPIYNSHSKWRSNSPGFCCCFCCSHFQPMKSILSICCSLKCKAMADMSLPNSLPPRMAATSGHPPHLNLSPSSIIKLNITYAPAKDLSNFITKDHILLPSTSQPKIKKQRSCSTFL